MAGTRASPSTTASCSGAGMPNLRKYMGGMICVPSTSRRAGTGPSAFMRTRMAATARVMAMSEACRILMRDISSIQARPMPQPVASWRISAARRSRSSALSTLESSRPMRSNPSGKMTAAATTGPARQPRPASSAPAVRASCARGAAKRRPCSMTLFFRVRAMFCLLVRG